MNTVQLEKFLEFNFKFSFGPCNFLNSTNFKFIFVMDNFDELSTNKTNFFIQIFIIYRINIKN